MHWTKLAFAALLAASGGIHATETWRVGNRIVAEGDSMPKVLRVAGRPDMKSRIESQFGGTVGNRWYYVREGYNAKTVIITFRAGRVVDIRIEKN